MQGLEGAPRRYAVLPHRYLSLSQAAIPFVIALALTQLLFVYNIVQTMRGAQKKPRSVATAEALFILAAIAAAIGIGVIGFFLGRDTAPKKSSGATRHGHRHGHDVRHDDDRHDDECGRGGQGSSSARPAAAATRSRTPGPPARSGRTSTT